MSRLDTAIDYIKNPDNTTWFSEDVIQKLRLASSLNLAIVLAGKISCHENLVEKLLCLDSLL